MPIEVVWDNDEKTIIRVTYNDPWTWDEAYAALDTIFEYSASVSHKVDAIHDMRDGQVIPRGALTQVRDMLMINKLSGIIVIVGMDRLLQTLYMMFSGLYSRLVEEHHMQLVATLDEAYARVGAAQAARSEHIS